VLLRWRLTHKVCPCGTFSFMFYHSSLSAP
jgi:hypothetical protein